MIEESLLLREFLDWVAARPRSYADTVEAWRSSCPRHPVLDDAFTAGLIASVGKTVILTTRGEALLGSDRSSPVPSASVWQTNAN
ncbi:MAG TPA: hypothetical protein VGH82_06885 [Gaiellaceae bacterium]|jgi:hypothetical protein